MEEKLNAGEVRCSKCQKIVKITDEHCPNCGTKTDPTGRFVQIVSMALIIGLGLVIGGVMTRVTSNADAFFKWLTIPMIVIGMLSLIYASFFIVMIILYKKGRKKAFDEMGVSK